MLAYPGANVIVRPQLGCLGNCRSRSQALLFKAGVCVCVCVCVCVLLLLSHSVVFLTSGVLVLMFSFTSLSLTCCGCLSLFCFTFSAHGVCVSSVTEHIQKTISKASTRQNIVSIVLHTSVRDCLDQEAASVPREL